MTDFMAYFQDRLDPIVDLLARMVEIESPSTDKDAADRMGAYVAERCRALGAEVETVPRSACGDLVLAKWNADAPGKPILALGHMDTVHPLGATAAAMPVRREGERLYGPGAVDMKGGIAVFLAAVEGLRELGQMPDRPVWALFTTDEETGSWHSAEYIQELAQQAGLVMVMEGPCPGGGLKTARKSTGKFTVTAVGRASHAGAAPEKGINAVVELAGQIAPITALADPAQGTTVTPTVIQGGTRENVMPDRAWLVVDVRVPTPAEGERITQAMHALAPRLPGARLEVEGGFDRPPMQRNALMVQTFERAAAIAEQIGHPPIEECSTGGGSDGNYSAALGIPTLDGLGPDGGAAHSSGEYVDIPTLPVRTALVAGLLVRWG